MESRQLANQQQLAQILKYDTRQIRRWLKHPDSPGLVDGKFYDVALWKEFAAAYGRKSPSERKAELEAEQLDIENQRKLLKLEQERGILTPNEVVDPALRHFSGLLQSELENLLERDLPVSWANKPSEQLLERGRQVYDRLMQRIQAGCARIKAQFPAPTEEEAAA